MPSDIAVYGLGVMGRNIALNLADHGFRVAVYNRTHATTKISTSWWGTTTAYSAA